MSERELPVLRMRLQNTEPVDLMDFTRSCLAFADEYRRHAAETDDPDAAEARLLIREVRSGSIEIDLVPLVRDIAWPTAALLAAHPTAAMSAANTLCSFVRNVGSTLDWLKGSAKAPERPPDRKSLENIEDFIEPVAKDAGATLNITVVKVNGDVNAPITVNCDNPGANVAQNVSKRKRKEMLTPQSGSVRKDVVLKWYQSRNAVSGAGDYAIVESIHPKPLRTVFQNKSMKSLLLAQADNLFQKLYLADVVVESVEGVPRLYRVLEIEPFDPEPDAA